MSMQKCEYKKKSPSCKIRLQGGFFFWAKTLCKAVVMNIIPDTWKIYSKNTQKQTWKITKIYQKCK